MCCFKKRNPDKAGCTKPFRILSASITIPGKARYVLSVGGCVIPTLVVTVRRAFASEDALLGSSFSTMATTLESFPYNNEINSGLCQFEVQVVRLYLPEGYVGKCVTYETN